MMAGRRAWGPAGYGRLRRFTQRGAASGEIGYGAVETLPRREGVLAIAATLYLVYRAVDLANLRDFVSWPWRVAVVAFAGAALCAVIGFVVSRRSLPRVGLSPRPGPTG